LAKSTFHTELEDSIVDSEGSMGATYDREQFARERTAQASSDTDAALTAPDLAQQCHGVLEKVTSYTRTQPWSALVMAAGLGLLIGRRLTAPRATRGLSGESVVHWPPHSTP
jgi:ElaB/YqjD/DUF883 family membrane-anchored ribosome-binding protein